MSGVKHLVMGFSTNQDPHSLRVFCSSLRKVYSPSECDIVIATNRYEPYFRDLAEYGVLFFNSPSNYSKSTGRLAKVINRLTLHLLRRSRSGLLSRRAPEITEAYRVLMETWHHPHFARWFAYLRYLDLNRAYDQVLLADVRDVVFQAPMFRSAPGDYLSFFLQGEFYGKGYWDTKWYREAWGDAELSKVMGRDSYCIGTIMGSHAHTLAIVRELVEFFGKHPFRGIEQAGFNYLIHTGQVQTPFESVDNITGPIATLSNAEAHVRTRCEDGFIRRASDGSVIPVVHMYDRFEDTAAVYAGA